MIDETIDNLNKINDFYNTVLKNKNYQFDKNQFEVMSEVSKNYNELSNTELTMKLSYIFNFHYSPDIIIDILKNRKDPVRLFVLYKLGYKNIDFDKDRDEPFKEKKTSKFLNFLSYVSLIICGIFFLGTFGVYISHIFNKQIENIYPIITIGSVIVLISYYIFYDIKNSMRMSELFFEELENKIKS